MDPVLDRILPEKFLGYIWESKPGPLGWQSDVLTLYQAGGSDINVQNQNNFIAGHRLSRLKPIVVSGILSNTRLGNYASWTETRA